MALSRTSRGSTSGSGSSRSLTAFTPANGSLLVAVYSGLLEGTGNPHTNSSVSGGGLTWTRQVAVQSADPVYNWTSWLTIWTAPVTTGSSTTVSGSNSGTHNETFLSCFEYTGQNASPIGGTASAGLNNVSGARSITLSASPASDSEVVAGASVDNWADTAANIVIVGTGWTEVFDKQRGSGEFSAQVQVRTGSTSTTVGWDAIDCDPPDSGGDALAGTATLGALEIKAAGGAAAFEIDADGGSYAITGTAASLERGREVAADGGSYAISGTAASLELGREVLAGGGSYALTGADATFDRTYVLTALGGSYSISGTAATLELGREVAADSGTYAITGTAASLELGREVAADGGSYAITGADATLTKSTAGAYTITADGGSYSVTGTAVTISRTYVVAADTASYSISGTAASLEINQEQPAEEPIREVNWPFASIYRRRREEEYKRLTAAEKKELVIEARKRVVEVIVLGEATTAKAAIEEVREDIAPAVPAKDWAAIAQRIEASARRAILRKQEEEDEEEILLLLH